jgi:predicted phosphodiesterase
MRVGVLNDVHGNLPALQAVLADVEAAGVDRIVLGGDIAMGPMPHETLVRILGLGDRVVALHGNADRELVGVFDGAAPDAGIPEELRAAAEHAGQLELLHAQLSGSPTRRPPSGARPRRSSLASARRLRP